MTKVMVLSILMMCVTAPSRILPAFLLSDRKLPRFVESFLHYIPFAILGALIFPDVLHATGSAYSSAAGAMAALLLGLSGRGIIVILTGAIASAFIAAQLGGM